MGRVCISWSSNHFTSSKRLNLASLFKVKGSASQFGSNWETGKFKKLNAEKNSYNLLKFDFRISANFGNLLNCSSPKAACASTGRMLNPRSTYTNLPS